ncbi:DUF7220 family protein [Pseudorhodoplanes sp.]|uniref:DUF7220 family protein n=1 Tax=Pseudorhodoplanes sp. TaxID=1934341 RepID=UPI003D0AC27D
MQQSHTMSLIEAVANVSTGFVLAVLTQIALFPWFDVRLSLSENMFVGGIFTLISVMRSYTLRRLFETIHGPRP